MEPIKVTNKADAQDVVQKKYQSAIREFVNKIEDQIANTYDLNRVVVDVSVGLRAPVVEALRQLYEDAGWKFAYISEQREPRIVLT